MRENIPVGDGSDFDTPREYYELDRDKIRRELTKAAALLTARINDFDAPGRLGDLDKIELGDPELDKLSSTA